MLRGAALVLFSALLSSSLFAIEPGKAEGSMTTDGKTTTLSYAYVVRKSHNDYSSKNDAIKLILTDQPIPAGTKLRDVDYTFPEGLTGLVVCIDKQGQPMHLVVQHPKGVYDGGWVSPEHDVTVREKDANGIIEGHLHCKKAEKASVTFAFDVDFAATEP